VQISSSGRFRYAFTSRRGGVSAAPYDSLNLGDHVGDDPEAARANRVLAAKALGVPAERIAYMAQVHGADVAVVRDPWPHEAAPQVDALVTDRPGLALAVMVADCVPVLLADEAAAVVGAAHAGRVGMAAGVVPAAVSAMCELGAAPERIVAHTGPAMCGLCYEVPETMRADVAAKEPTAWSTTRQGTPGLDVPAAVAAQLRRAGVPEANLRLSRECTAENPDYYSYRRDGVTGRFAGFVWFEED